MTPNRLHFNANSLSELATSPRRARPSPRPGDGLFMAATAFAVVALGFCSGTSLSGMGIAELGTCLPILRLEIPKMPG